jgi:hypothetical protein
MPQGDTLNVTMEDGFVIHNVPKGTSQQELRERYRLYREMNKPSERIGAAPQGLEAVESAASGLAQRVARRDPSLGREVVKAAPFAVGLGLSAIPQTSMLGQMGMAALGAGGATLTRQLAVRDVPFSASDVAESAAAGAFFTGLGEMVPLAVRFRRRWPTTARRERGALEIKKGIERTGAREVGVAAETDVQAASRRLLESREKLHGGLISQEEERLSALKPAPPVPGVAIPPRQLGRQIRSAMRTASIRLPRAIEKRGYEALYSMADNAGIVVPLEETSRVAGQLFHAETPAILTGLPTIKWTTAKAEQVIAGRPEFGTDVAQLVGGTRGQALPMRQIAKILGISESELSTNSLRDVRKLLEGINQRIADLQGVAVAGSPELRALETLKGGVEHDIGSALKPHPELQGLYDDVKGVTTERKGVTSRQRTTKKILTRIEPTPPERIPGIVTATGAETIPGQVTSAMSIGPATRAALSRYKDDPVVARLAQRAEAMTKAAKLKLGKYSVRQVIVAGDMGGEWDAAKALRYMEERPALAKHMGHETYDGLKVGLEAQARAQAEVKTAADLKALESTLSDDEAEFKASHFGRVVNSIAQQESLPKSYDYLLAEPSRVAEVTRMLPEAGQRAALAHGMFDRLVERATRPDGVFNAAEWAKLWQTYSPSIRATQAAQVTEILDSLAMTLNTLSRGLSYKVPTMISTTERAGPFRIWGLGQPLVEFLTNKPSHELAIQPRHILAISRDPHLKDLFREAVALPRWSKYGRYVASSLAYALYREEAREGEE